MNVKVIDRRSQNPTQATIAFTLAYDGETPALAQKVAHELTSLFLGENLKTRERHAHETTAFLKRESENLARHISELEEKISLVKQRRTEPCRSWYNSTCNCSIKLSES